MSIKRLPPEAIETFSMVLHPKRRYIARRLDPDPLPEILNLSYSLGDTSGGGEYIVITGLEFDDLVSVDFDGIPATIEAQTPTSVTVQLPAHAAGVVDVRVTTVAGTSAPASFEYWTPAQISGVSAYWDADKGVTLVGSDVDVWVDQSANARIASAASRPELVPFAFGKSPGLRFTPQDRLVLSRVALADGLSIFWVGSWTSADASAGSSLAAVPLTVVGDDTNGFNAAGASAGSIAYDQWTGASNVVTRGSGLNDGEARIVGWTHDSSTGDIKAYVSGLQEGATANVAYSVASNGYNMLGNGYTSVDGWAGDVGAIVVVSGVISSDDRNKQYLWARQRFAVLAT